MAKQPRMGRNLNALLGGAVRERSSKTQSDEQKSQAAVQAAESIAVESIAGDSSPVEPESGKADATVGKATPTTDALSAQTPELISVESAAHAKPLAESPRHTETDNTSDSGVQTTAQSDSNASSNASDSSGEHLIMLGVEKIRRGTYQPRRLFDPELLQELADSIKAQGMIQPIIVRPFADAFELVAGERRWRAAQLAGIDRIPAIVRTMEDRSVAAVSVIENIQRKDLNPLEEAAAFERLCDEFGMTHKAVAEAVGRSRASITNLMRLLELHDEVKVMVDKGELEMGHARALLGAPRSRQPDIARRVIKQGMTVRAVEQYVRSLDAEGNEVPASAKDAVNDPDIERLSKKLGDKLGAKVQITHKDNGAGKLQISYSSVSELQGILAHIK